MMSVSNDLNDYSQCLYELIICYILHVVLAIHGRWNIRLIFQNDGVTDYGDTRCDVLLLIVLFTRARFDYHPVLLSENIVFIKGTFSERDG